jgi:hypothetical protein
MNKIESEQKNWIWTNLKYEQKYKFEQIMKKN